MLSSLIFLPLIFAFFGYFLNGGAAKVGGIFFSLIILIINYICIKSGLNSFELSLIHKFNFGINLEASNIAFVLAFIANFMLFASLCFFSYKKDLLIAAMILSACMNGLFFANDALLFYIFWEASLLPLLYLMVVKGEAKLARSFFIFAFIGSIFMLIAMIVLAYDARKAGMILNFNISDFRLDNFSSSAQAWLFLAFFLAFAIKAPIFPFHSWAIKTYDKAPNFVSVMLVSFKMAPFGFIKFCLPLFADVILQYQGILMGLCTFSAIYAAFLASAATNFKQLSALSSISHLGIICLGLFSLNEIAVQGSVFYMVAHALVSGAMFFYAEIFKNNYKTYEFKAFSSLAKAMPFMTFIFGIMLFSSISLPLTVNFVGEFMVLVGSFWVNKTAGIFACLVVILGAVYMLNMFRNIFLKNRFEMPKVRVKICEIAVLCFIAFFVLYLGIFPSNLLDYIFVGGTNGF